MPESKRSPKKPKVSHESSTRAPENKPILFDRPDFSEPAAMAAFFVTEDGKTEKFLVHKEHACYYSPIFKAAFNSNSQEGRTGEYRIEVPQPPPQERIDERAEENWPLMDAEQQNLFELWILACIPRLQNKVVDSFRFALKDCKRTLCPASFHFVYDNTKADGILRNLIVILTAVYLRVASFKRRSDMYPREMLVDIVALMLGRSGEEIDDALLVLLKDICHVKIPDGK